MKTYRPKDPNSVKISPKKVSSIPTIIRSETNLFILFAVSIFIGEILIMLFLKTLPPFSNWTLAFIDATLLTMVILPINYVFLFIPLQKRIRDQNKNEIEDEQKLQDLFKQHITLIEAIPDAIIFKDGMGRWLITNQVAKDIFRMKDDSWIGKSSEELVKTAEKGVTSSIEKAIDEDRETWKSGHLSFFNKEIQDADGKTRYFEIRKVPLYEADGERKSILTIGKDITKSKEEEAKLKQFETIIKHASDGIVITEIDQNDLTGPRIIYVNDAYLKMTGYTKEELIGQTPRIFHGKKTDREELNRTRKAILNYEPYEMEILNYKKNGKAFWSTVSIAPIANAEGMYTHWIGIKRDITKQKKQTLDINRAILMAQEKEKFHIGSEIHDNVLQILVGSLFTSDLIKNLSEQEKIHLDETRNYIKTSIQELRALSHQLAPVVSKDHSLKESIENLLQDFNKTKKFDLHFNIMDAIGKPIDPDIQLSLYRIIQEQLQNILKHSGATFIQILLNIGKDKIALKIFDNGKGFDTELQKHNGIGFSNIKRRIEIFSGSLSIKSSVGNGCEIIVEIPF